MRREADIMGERMLTSAVRNRFETSLRSLTAYDGIERVGLAGWWSEASIRGVRYEVAVVDMGDRFAWSIHMGRTRAETRFVEGGTESTAALAWWSGYCAVADHRAAIAELSEDSRREGLPSSPRRVILS